MAIAWGGQVVCTATTASLLADDLELEDLGEHRLRDLSRPERVWQLGSGSFPPLRSGSTLPGNLPTQVTEFVGREAELRDVGEAVESARIITLTGVGGAGKTRLALQSAAEAQPQFRHGAWLCELAPLTSPDAVDPLVAGVLSVEPSADGGWVSAIVEKLRDRQLLLVLDNCEHVLDAAAALADAIVRACPEIVVIATSREGLGVAGERILPVGSLGLPAWATAWMSLARPTRSACSSLAPVMSDHCRPMNTTPSRRLRRCVAASTAFPWRSNWRRRARNRCRLLRSPVTSTTASSSSRAGRARLSADIRPCRAAIDWSFDLLSESEQRVLTRASVFAGGFTLDAVAAVCDPGTTSAIEILDHVDGLVRRSMLIAEEDGTATRYRMLETIRQYGAERLEALGDAAETSRAHLDWCAAFAHDVGEQLRSPDDAAAAVRMDREVDNIRAALQFAVSIGDLDAAKMLLASAPIGALWDNRLGGSMAALAKEVAEALGEPDHPVSAALLSLLALDAALRFAGDEAVELAERACVAARRHDDWLRTGPWLAWLLSSLIAHRPGTVMVAAQEALGRAIADEDGFAIAEWHAELGVAHWMAGDVEEAQRQTEIGLTLAEEIGADNLVMRNAFFRGTSFLVPGSDAAVALEYFKRAVRLGERVGGNVLYGGAAWALLLFNRGEENVTVAALVRELAANLATAMFMLDAKGMMVFYNDAAAMLLGKPFEEVGEIPSEVFGGGLDLTTIDGLPLRRRDSPAGIAFFERRPAHQKVMATGYDGARRAYNATSHPLFGPGNELQGIVSVFWEHTTAGEHGH